MMEFVLQWSGMHLRLHGSPNDSIINDMIYVISTS